MKISVALCTYNGEKYLAEQLKSILNQTFPPNEIIIRDDASVDDTGKILRNFEQLHPSIRVTCNAENTGYVANFEEAILSCTGDLVFLSDQDDIWHPKKIETIADLAQRNKEKMLFAHRTNLLLENGTILSASFWDLENFNIKFTNEQLFKYLLFERNVFPGMSMALTKKAIQKYFPLKKINRTFIHDYELALRAAYDGDLMLADQELATYRMHQGQNIGINVQSLNQPAAKDRWYIHNLIKRRELVQEAIEKFQLEPSLKQEYINFVKKKYKTYLNQFPIPARYKEHLKNKFYYKILNGLS